MSAESEANGLVSGLLLPQPDAQKTIPIKLSGNQFMCVRHFNVQVALIIDVILSPRCGMDGNRNARRRRPAG